MKWPRVVVLLGLATLVGVGLVGVVLAWQRYDGSGGATNHAQVVGASVAAESRAQDYARTAGAGQIDATYDLLSDESKKAISSAEWHRRNQEALAEFGDITESRVVSSRSASDEEVIVEIEFTFSRAGSITASVPFVLENGEWKAIASIAPS